MKYIGKRILAKNGDSALLVNNKIVLTNEKLDYWLYYVNDIRQIQPGVYIAEGLTPIETGVMNTTSLTFGDYKIYRRPFFISERKVVVNIENINKPYENKYYGGADHPIAFVGVELEGYFPQFNSEFDIDEYAKELGKKYNALTVSATNDTSIKTRKYKTREIKYMIDRSNLGVLKNLYNELGIKQNKSCGNHIHVSFNLPEYYWLVFSPIFYERFKRAYEQHFKKEKYISRLSSEYCGYTGINTVFNNTRYKMINDKSFFKYGTAEFRILPYVTNGKEYYEGVKFVVETTEKILNDLVKEEYLQRILSDYAIPLVVLDDIRGTDKSKYLLKYFYQKERFPGYSSPYINFALLYYPEKQKILFFEYPIFSYLLITNLTSKDKPTELYYRNIDDILYDLHKNKDIDTLG